MKKIKKRKYLKKSLKIFIILSILWVFAFYLYNTYQKIEINDNYIATRTQSTLKEQTVENVQNNSKKIADVLEETTQKVVGISKLKETGNSILSKSSESELGLGTGFIVTEDGYIVSNEHVTGSKYSRCYITLENGTNYDGTVVWSDSDLDLSITKINATSGIISAKNRTIKIEEESKSSYMTDLIQTDATINPGNSGGPLIYPNGDIIGINTVKISTAEGIGFAIPINIIRPIIESFKQIGNFEEATIGIYAYDKEVVPYLNTNLNNNFQKGIYVAQITSNGPADNTELKNGDIITSIDNIELNTMNDLREYIYTKKPNDEVNLKIIRGKINKEFNIVLGKK